MEIGFDTIGNATLIAHDQRPVLVTDPWIEGSAYFGSWKLSHEVPPEQREAALAAPYVWFSHGHPDHLNPDSLPLFQGKKILLPNHFGGRISEALQAQGFDVQVMVDRQWLQLSPRIRVMCIPDYNQDAILFLDINGRLVFNKNDSNDRGWARFAKKVIQQFPMSFHLALFGFGGADMMNYFAEDGTRRLPSGISAPTPLGARVAREVELFGTRYFVPFSSMHRFQRTDSAWASAYASTFEDFKNGFDATGAELLPPFIRFDCDRDQLTELNPAPTSSTLLPPEHFDDHWADPLSAEEAREVVRYFKAVEKLGDTLDFLRLRVGGRDTAIEFRSQGFRRGLTIETPRASLLSSVRFEIFDDLLIGNFAKVVLHGDWGPGLLYPDVTPYIAKYGDNGRARTHNEVRDYFRHYRNRDPVGYLHHQLTQGLLEPARAKAANTLRNRVGKDSKLFQTAKSAFWAVRRSL